MAIIDLVKPEEADGKVQEYYNVMLEKAGMVPMPMQMWSASPDLFGVSMQAMGYYFTHPTLNPILLTQIRLMAADHCEYPYCVNFNTNILKMMAGMSDEQVTTFMTNPAEANLEEKDKELLLFVKKAINDPGSTEQADIDKLRDLGWNDRDIFDATNHAANMVAGGILFKAFKVGE